MQAPISAPQIKVVCAQTPNGSWTISGLSLTEVELGNFQSRERALEVALEKVGTLNSWQVIAIDSQGKEVAIYNSADDAMQWHVD